ncbi:MAG: hypothetical protein LBI71_11885 [Enterobacteriaceae bacterium]|jgi:hypothetical protein|nr:hypothetical protein [Enterobacteriaceae bacterium]
MALDVAFAIEIDDFVDPDRAYELFWSGIITDKKAFICPGENCSAQVTCANLDEESQNMKVVPHFRIYGEHHPDCELILKVPFKIDKIIELTKKQEKISINQSMVDSFTLIRPNSYYDSNKISNDRHTKIVDKKKYHLQILSENIKQTGSIGRIYSVRSMVSRYLRYHNDGSLNLRKINVKGKDFSYKDFFKSIHNQNIEYLFEHPIIYHGWAYIDKYKTSYRIKFKKCFIVNNQETPVTFFVTDELINSYPIKKLIIKRMQKISKQPKPTAFVFIYAKPKLVKSKKNGKEYINFNVNNLDFIDINVDAPLPNKK